MVSFHIFYRGCRIEIFFVNLINLACTWVEHQSHQNQNLHYVCHPKEIADKVGLLMGREAYKCFGIIKWGTVFNPCYEGSQ